MTREEAIHILNGLKPTNTKSSFDAYVVGKAIVMAIEALSTEPCEDCISFPKGTLKKRMKGYVVYNYAWLKENWQTELKVMGIEPSVQPKPKTGHWIRISPAEIYECSECGQNVMTSDICAYKFCHGCGAKMLEPQERSDKE